MSPRTVSEWVGKNPDTPIPPRVKGRILRKQEFKCALTGLPLTPGNTDYDHIVALINGGENREANIRAVARKAHKEKTRADVAEKVKTDAMTIAAFKLKQKAKFKQRPKAEKPRRERIELTGESNIHRRFRAA